MNPEQILEERLTKKLQARNKKRTGGRAFDPASIAAIVALISGVIQLFGSLCNRDPQPDPANEKQLRRAQRNMLENQLERACRKSRRRGGETIRYETDFLEVAEETILEATPEERRAFRDDIYDQVGDDD